MGYISNLAFIPKSETQISQIRQLNLINNLRQIKIISNSKDYRFFVKVELI
jgi:hypothetical protein